MFIIYIDKMLTGVPYCLWCIMYTCSWKEVF